MNILLVIVACASTVIHAAKNVGFWVPNPGDSVRALPEPLQKDFKEFNSEIVTDLNLIFPSSTYTVTYVTLGPKETGWSWNMQGATPVLTSHYNAATATSVSSYKAEATESRSHNALTIQKTQKSTLITSTMSSAAKTQTTSSSTSIDTNTPSSSTAVDAVNTQSTLSPDFTAANTLGSSLTADAATTQTGTKPTLVTIKSSSCSSSSTALGNASVTTLTLALPTVSAHPRIACHSAATGKDDFIVDPAWVEITANEVCNNLKSSDPLLVNQKAWTRSAFDHNAPPDGARMLLLELTNMEIQSGVRLAANEELVSTCAENVKYVWRFCK